MTPEQYDRYRKIILKVAYSFDHIPLDEKQDVVQDVLEKFLRADGDHIENKEAYLRQTTRNHCIDSYRLRKRKVAHIPWHYYPSTYEVFDDDFYWLQTMRVYAVRLQYLLTEKEWELVHALKEVLPDSPQTKLRKGTFEVLAEKLGIPRGAARSRMTRLRRKAAMVMENFA